MFTQQVLTNCFFLRFLETIKCALSHMYTIEHVKFLRFSYNKYVDFFIKAFFIMNKINSIIDTTLTLTCTKNKLKLKFI